MTNVWLSTLPPDSIISRDQQSILLFHLLIVTIKVHNIKNQTQHKNLASWTLNFSLKSYVNTTEADNAIFEKPILFIFWLFSQISDFF